jgi:hypothetical protein
MTEDHLFMRADRAVRESYLLRDERRIMRHQFSDTREELRLSVLAMAKLRAEIDRERKSWAAAQGGTI